MLTIKASLAFKKSNISDKVKFGGNVTNALAPSEAKGSLLTPDLPVPVSELVQLTADLSAADEGLVNGGRNARQAANNAVAAWDEAFTATANYITMIANSDAFTISRAGFKPTKAVREKKPLPGAATTFKATINGKKGAILTGAARGVAGASAHVVTALPPGATITYQENTVVITVGNENIYLGAFTGKGTELYSLVSGKPYAVSMFSFNAAGLGPATPYQEVIPQ